MRENEPFRVISVPGRPGATNGNHSVAPESKSGGFSLQIDVFLAVLRKSCFGLTFGWKLANWISQSRFLPKFIFSKVSAESTFFKIPKYLRWKGLFGDLWWRKIPFSEKNLSGWRFVGGRPPQKMTPPPQKWPIFFGHFSFWQKRAQNVELLKVTFRYTGSGVAVFFDVWSNATSGSSWVFTVLSGRENTFF